MGWSEIMMHPIEGAKKTPLNGCVRNNDAFTAGRAVAHLTHASSQKVGGRSGDILGRSGDALAHSGDTPGRSMTLQDAPGRSGTLQGRFGGHSGGLCGHFGDGWMMLMMVVMMVMSLHAVCKDNTTCFVLLVYPPTKAIKYLFGDVPEQTLLSHSHLTSGYF